VLNKYLTASVQRSRGLRLGSSKIFVIEACCKMNLLQRNRDILMLNVISAWKLVRTLPMLILLVLPTSQVRLISFNNYITSVEP